MVGGFVAGGCDVGVNRQRSRVRWCCSRRSHLYESEGHSRFRSKVPYALVWGRKKPPVFGRCTVRVGIADGSSSSPSASSLPPSSSVGKSIDDVEEPEVVEVEEERPISFEVRSFRSCGSFEQMGRIDFFDVSERVAMKNRRKRSVGSGESRTMRVFAQFYCGCSFLYLCSS